MHDRDGQPETVFAACLLPDGRRAWGITADRDEAAAFCEGEWVGQAVRLDAEGRLLLASTDGGFTTSQVVGARENRDAGSYDRRPCEQP